MAMRCIHCGSRQFAVSRFREADFHYLRRLQYPVRCVQCHDRSHIFFWQMLGVKLHGAARDSGKKRD